MTFVSVIPTCRVITYFLYKLETTVNQNEYFLFLSHNDDIIEHPPPEIGHD